MLRTLALLALVCFCAGAKTYRRTMPMPDNADLEPMASEPMPFRAHTEHRFLYNMQIASGLIAPSDEDATVSRILNYALSNLKKFGKNLISFLFAVYVKLKLLKIVTLLLLLYNPCYFSRRPSKRR